MALSEDLVRFVRDALERGLPRGEIEAVLLRARWPPDQVRRALDGFADVDFPIPVPQPASSVSAREAFLYVLMFTTLALSTFNLGSLLFEIIDRALPDPARRETVTQTLPAIRWSLSALIVAFPIFLWVAWLIARSVRADPTKRSSKIRRRLAYLALFIAACFLIGDVMGLVYNFLGGELTARFLLKVGTVGAIAGTVFGYYLSELKREEREPET